MKIVKERRELKKEVRSHREEGEMINSFLKKRRSNFKGNKKML